MSSESKEAVVEYMDPELLPTGYKALLSPRQVHEASDAIKLFVEARLRSDLHLFKHTAPLAFVAGTGINDDLDGSKSKAAVRFHVPNVVAPRGIAVDESKREPERFGFDAEVVQSLAKWKRVMLKRYDCEPNEGMFCESFSIRKGYKGDVTHSNICDQWDWEIRLKPEERTRVKLEAVVRTLWSIITDAEQFARSKFPALAVGDALPKDIHIVTAQELHDRWPDADVHGRENHAVEEWGAVFILGMGWPMSDGAPAEEVRAPDYDDWNLNGDIMVRHPVTGYRHELSSMGIRVNAESLAAQLEHRGMQSRASLPFHRALAAGDLPQCMGGGIGISRLLMLILRTGHVGEVQVGIWADAHHAQARAAGISLIPDRIL